MKIRVYHFILDHRLGGPHVYVRNLQKELESKIEAFLVTSGRGPETDIALLNLRHTFRWLYPIEVIFNIIWLCFLFWHHRNRNGVIFDVHGAGNLAPILAARLLNIPLVWHFHETSDSFSVLVDLGKNVITGIPHRIIAVAERAVVVFDLKDAILISGAVDFDFWSSKKYEPQSQNNSDRLRILSVGNLNPLKGMDLLLAALEDFNWPWELIVVGAELKNYLSYAQKLRECARRLDSSLNTTRFIGWQSQEKIRSLMINSDVFVLPSRSEACPLALLEAMAAGCLCIATDVGDVRNILEATGSGIVVPNEAPTCLAKALNQIKEMKILEQRRIRKIAQETVRQRYSLQEQARKHLAIYMDLVPIRE